jgi:hypothetical protein
VWSGAQPGSHDRAMITQAGADYLAVPAAPLEAAARIVHPLVAADDRVRLASRARARDPAQRTQAVLAPGPVRFAEHVAGPSASSPGQAR